MSICLDGRHAKDKMWPRLQMRMIMKSPPRMERRSGNKKLKKRRCMRFAPSFNEQLQ